MNSITKFHVLCRTNKNEPVYLGDVVDIKYLGRAEVKYNKQRMAIMFYTNTGPIYFSKVHGMITQVLLHVD